MTPRLCRPDLTLAPTPSPRPSRSRARSPGALLAVLPLLVGCINDDVELYEVRLRGDASAPSRSGDSGTLHLEFHHRQSSGRGALAHPLGEIDRRTLTAAALPVPIDETLLYPTQAGQGLLVYGWLDLDGDGILCAPGQKNEPAGIVEVQGFPARSLSFNLRLVQPCAGPERLYP